MQHEYGNLHLKQRTVIKIEKARLQWIKNDKKIMKNTENTENKEKWL